MTVPDPLEAYRTAEARHGAVLDRARSDVRFVETGRVVTFLVAALAALLRNDLPIGATWSLAIAGVATVAFVALVVRHRRLKAGMRRAEVGAGLARLGALRLWRQWDEIADQHAALGYSDALLDPGGAGVDGHAYAEDLDVFGPASLRALLGPTPSPTGVRSLRRWLGEPSAPREVARRQSAVRSLAVDFAGREALATEALLVDAVDDRAWRGFLDWLREEPVFGTTLPRWAPWVARVLPAVTILLFVLQSGLGLPLSRLSWGIPFAMQLALAWWWGGALRGYFARVTENARGLRRYHALFAAWENYRSDDPAVSEVQRRLVGEGGRPASVEVRRLERWLDATDSRASMFHVVFAVMLLEDVHLAWGLERWRVTAGARVEGWFDAVGELEALAALATLAHDHPDWCWPELRDGVPGLEAEELGHPLISEGVLRRSDVRVDPPGRFLLVTGSNMSGKSTLLRSLGLAAVMAQAGAPVCARRLVMTPLRTFTSMRIHDSLRDGVSYFMAELNRLKKLVDAAGRNGEAEPALLYLIDEVLQGTNSEERRVAARRIVSHLLDAHAIGAVTTHDLSLHEDDRLDPAATKVHFREHVGGEAGGAVLTFDYKLRPGLATSRNALKLLEIVGLGES